MSELPSECHDRKLCKQLGDEQALQALSLQELFGLSFSCGGIAIGVGKGMSCPEMNGSRCLIRSEDKNTLLWELIKKRMLADSINPN